MKNKTVKLLLALNLTAMVFVGLTLQGLNPETVNVENKTVDVTTETVTPDVSCPEPAVNITNEYENIANPDINTDTRLIGDTLEVENIDITGKLYGNSMHPSIMDGDTVLLTEFNGQELEQGMIIRFKNQQGTYMIHRVWGNYQPIDYVMTKGDNNENMERVNVSQVTHVARGVLY